MQMFHINFLGCELTERSEAHFESEQQQQQQQLLLMSWDNGLKRQLHCLTVKQLMPSIDAPAGTATGARKYCCEAAQTYAL